MGDFHNIARDPVGGILVADMKQPNVCGGQITRDTGIAILKRGFFGVSDDIKEASPFAKINQG